jgi:hypothetical protein
VIAARAAALQHSPSRPAVKARGVGAALDRAAQLRRWQRVGQVGNDW